MARPTNNFLKRLMLISCFFGGICKVFSAPNDDSTATPENIKAFSRQFRVDLVWDAVKQPVTYEIRRSEKAGGNYIPLSVQLTNLNVNVYSDFIGQGGREFYYQIRSHRFGTNDHSNAFSDWSAVCHARSQFLDTNQLLTEVQEAGFRYFYDYAQPVSGLSRIGTRANPDVCSSGDTGFGMFNLVVGIDRGFITRPQGISRALKILTFLTGKADRFHGAFSHLIDGSAGKALPFGHDDDGADIVETAFLMQGVLLWREYFSGTGPDEVEIRKLSDGLWRAVEWDWFATRENGQSFMRWHWSPDHGWLENDKITGFNECQIVYLLALASPTHAVQPQVYWQGWQTALYATHRMQFGIPLELGPHDFGPPLFWIQFSYLGLDPHSVRFDGKTYFEHFNDICRIEMLYGQSRSNHFEGYGSFWGWTAGYGPDNYKEYLPGGIDDGTINPSAAISSMPYVPDASRALLFELYANHGSQCWGPFGFYDSFNLSRNWFARDYLGNDVGPLAPMIENYRTGLCWKIFMNAPEIRNALKMLNSRTEHSP